VREEEPTRFLPVRVVTVQSQDSLVANLFSLLGYIGESLKLLIGCNSNLVIK
jgi:hypothetical protein